MRRFIQYLLILGCLLIPVSVAWSEPPAQRTTQQKETTVYITRTGKKYHRGNCRYLSRSKIATTKGEAVKNKPCKVFKPQVNISIESPRLSPGINKTNQILEHQ